MKKVVLVFVIMLFAFAANEIHSEYGLFALNKNYSEQISSEKLFFDFVILALNKDFSEHFTLNTILFRDHTEFVLCLMYIQMFTLNK